MMGEKMPDDGLCPDCRNSLVKTWTGVAYHPKHKAHHALCAHYDSWWKCERPKVPHTVTVVFRLVAPRHTPLDLKGAIVEVLHSDDLHGKKLVKNCQFSVAGIEKEINDTDAIEGGVLKPGRDIYVTYERDVDERLV